MNAPISETSHTQKITLACLACLCFELQACNKHWAQKFWTLKMLHKKLFQASPVFFSSSNKSQKSICVHRPVSPCIFVKSPTMGCKDKKQSLIGQVSKGEFDVKTFLKVKRKLWLANFVIGMWFRCEQPFLWGEHCESKGIQRKFELPKPVFLWLKLPSWPSHSC